MLCPRGLRRRDLGYVVGGVFISPIQDASGGLFGALLVVEFVLAASVALIATMYREGAGEEGPSRRPAHSVADTTAMEGLRGEWNVEMASI